MDAPSAPGPGVAVEDGSPAGDEISGGMPGRGQGLRDATAALRVRNFALFWVAALVSNTGTWMQNVAVPFVLFKLTHHAGWVGVGAFAQWIPALFVGPAAGSLADRFPRRTILIVTQALAAAAAAALWILWVSGHATPTGVILILAVNGVIAGFNIPAWQAFVSDLVPRELLLNAVTLNSAQFNAARAFGPALGGIVLALLGAGWAFLLNAISFGAVIGALVAIRLAPIVRAAVGRTRVGTQFAETVRYMRARRGIRTCVLVVTAIGFLGWPIFSMVIVFADDVFHTGGFGYGVLSACLGIGAVLAAPFVAGRGATMRRGVLVGGSLLSYGVAMLMFALAPAYGFAVVGLMLAGGSWLAVASTLNTTIQLQVDEAMRGKVISAYMMGLTASMPLGTLLQGYLVDAWGPRVTVTSAGALLVVLAVWLRIDGRLVSLDDAGALPSAQNV